MIRKTALMYMTQVAEKRSGSLLGWLEHPILDENCKYRIEGLVFQYSVFAKTLTAPGSSRVQILYGCVWISDVMQLQTHALNQLVNHLDVRIGRV